MRKLKGELERGFFCRKFSEIKTHPSLRELELKDQDIIDYREKIKTTIDSWEQCGNSQICCQSLNTHYSLKRNEANRLILETYTCKKTKRFEDIPEELINKKIQESIKDPYYRFTLEEAKKALESLTQEMGSVSILKNLGDPQYELKNLYFCASETVRRNLSIIYLFHAVLTGLETSITTSQKMKEAYLQNTFDKIKTDFEIYQEVPFLIIEDFGLENKGAKGNYYLDGITELLRRRYAGNKSTYIFTPITWKDILKSVREEQIKGTDRLVTSIKLESLENIVKKVFSLTPSTETNQ